MILVMSPPSSQGIQEFHIRSVGMPLGKLKPENPTAVSEGGCNRGLMSEGDFRDRIR